MSDEEEASPQPIDSQTEELARMGIYRIQGYIKPGSLDYIQRDILLQHAKGRQKEIQLVINSPGGDVDETWALIDLLSYTRQPIRTLGMGCCGSAAACILACGDHRMVLENTAIMIHGATGSAYGNYQQIKADIKGIRDDFNRDIIFWTRHSNLNKAKIMRKLLNGRDNWFTATEALTLGVIDEII